ncbi:hypothetical protein KSD_72740 [Ktedonobacter sp. SOSP1-85]|uniref:hypothetical protein n=1 Tax=Ktedonobacter sp. SOSP1-85 TaxID=2778367 RepID=UPI00191558D9|nr:hypothetical protein [Ktedonobacter sp. SOSP1-85]GHO79503.1 hypothetical protein KSD_72740 [Ktedonobacter sp. SOSP1-85]
MQYLVGYDMEGKLLLSMQGNDFRTRNIVSSAYVLYPGNRMYEEGDGDVGGIPLRPNMPSQLQEAARKKLHDILYEANMI